MLVLCACADPGTKPSGRLSGNAPATDSKDRSSSAGLPVAGTQLRDCAKCPLMMVLPSGEFSMGASIGEQDRLDNEGPLHRVAISKFAVSKYEITFDEW